MRLLHMQVSAHGFGKLVNSILGKTPRHLMGVRVMGWTLLKDTGVLLTHSPKYLTKFSIPKFAISVLIVPLEYQFNIPDTPS